MKMVREPSALLDAVTRLSRKSNDLAGPSAQRLRCAAGRKNATFRAEFLPCPKCRQNVQTRWRREGDFNPRNLCGIPKSPNLRAIWEGLTEQNRSSTGLAVRRESSLCVSLGGQSPRS
jgi:hypothetical protein